MANRCLSRIAGGCLVFVVLVVGGACAREEPVAWPSAGTANAAGGPVRNGAAGSPGAGQRGWTGIQACTGSIDYEEIDATSEETAISEFTKTKTRVHLSGITAGPSSEISCDGLQFDAVVTSGDDTSVHFRSNEPVSCASRSGRGLLVGWLEGHDFDSRPLGGDYWRLKFSLRIEDQEAADAGASMRTFVRCEFELEM